jgi:competence protein ComEC
MQPLDDVRAEAVRDQHFACDRRWCLPKAGETISGWWGKRAPSADQMAELCVAQVVVLRSPAPPLPPACSTRLVLDKAAFDHGGSAELYRSDAGWRIVWAQSLRGARPWSVSDSAG